MVQDLPPVIAAAEKEVPPELAGRTKFMPHDFLTEQPVHGADVYFFRWILHNWSDKYCIKILRNLIPALKPGARVVINDNVLPQPGVLSQWQEERLRYSYVSSSFSHATVMEGQLMRLTCRSMDLTMSEIQNSREREVDDWAKLFEMAGPGFEFQGARLPKGANLWILVAEWKGN